MTGTQAEDLARYEKQVLSAAATLAAALNVACDQLKVMVDGIERARGVFGQTSATSENVPTV